MSEDRLVTAGTYAPRHALRLHSKVDDPSLVIVVRGFCLGLSVATTARQSGVGEKTTRGLYQSLRARLTKPAFNKWHHGGNRLVRVSSTEIEDAVRDAFFDTLSQCHGNRTCRRNWTAGNRKTRLCRACPIPDRLRDEANVPLALETVDTVHAFYDRLGIKGERGVDRVTLFKLRLLHTATIITMSEGTPWKSGRMDLAYRDFTSFRTLFETMIAELLENPLAAGR